MFCTHLLQGCVSTVTFLFPAAVTSILAYCTLMFSLRLISATLVSVLGTMEVVVSFLVQVMVRGEAANSLAVLGAVLVVACTTLVVLEDAYWAKKKLETVKNSEESIGA